MQNLNKFRIKTFYMWFRNDKSATAISSAQIHMHANQRKAKKKHTKYKIKTTNKQHPKARNTGKPDTKHGQLKWRSGGLVDWWSGVAMVFRLEGLAPLEKETQPDQRFGFGFRFDPIRKASRVSGGGGAQNVRFENLSSQIQFGFLLLIGAAAARRDRQQHQNTKHERRAPKSRSWQYT